MELSKLIFIVAVFIVVLIFILFPEARTLFSGFTRLFTVKKSIRHRMPTVKQIMRIALPQEN